VETHSGPERTARGSADIASCTTVAVSSPLRSTICSGDPAYQVFRSLLLGCRTVERGELDVVEARTIVVCPDANDAYRTLPHDHALASLGVDSVETLMNHLLRDPSRFGIVSYLSSGVPLPLGWAEYHTARYDWTAPRGEGSETRR
jgi:hypothetical protein